MCSNLNSGTVHRATFRDGTLVAVKVRHPGVVMMMATDFYLMGRLAAAIELIPGLEWLDVKSLVGQFGESLSSQVYLNVEGDNLQLASHHFRAWTDVAIPRVFHASPAVLIEAFVPGRTVGSYTSLGGGGSLAARELSKEQRRYIVRRGVDIYLKMLLVDNLMHADLHPGNILFDATAARGDGKPRLGLVDFGLVTELHPEEQKFFIGFLRALSDGDGAAAAACVLRWSSHQACATPEAQSAFIDDLAASFRTICRGFGTGTQLGDVLRSTLELVRVHRVSIAASYMTLVVNALCLEGLAKELEPRYNVLDAARPLLATSGALNAPSPLFRAVLPALQLAKRLHDSREAAQ